MLKRSFPRLFWRIGAVARMTGIPQHVLRGWEREFAQLRPRRDQSGVRVYRERDLRFVLLLQTMVNDKRQPTAQVRSFLDEDPARVEALLDAIDLEAALAARSRHQYPSDQTREVPMSDDYRLDQGDRTAAEEPDEPDPWDDGTPIEPGSDGDRGTAPSASATTPEPEVPQAVRAEESQPGPSEGEPVDLVGVPDEPPREERDMTPSALVTTPEPEVPQAVEAEAGQPAPSDGEPVDVVRALDEPPREEHDMTPSALVTTPEPEVPQGMGAEQSQPGPSDGEPVDVVRMPEEPAREEHDDELPAWAVAELRALRDELVALEQMVESFIADAPANGDDEQAKVDTQV